MPAVFYHSVKHGLGIDLVLERACPEEHPKSEKNRAALANNATVSVSPKILQLDL